MVCSSLAVLGSPDTPTEYVGEIGKCISCRSWGEVGRYFRLASCRHGMRIDKHGLRYSDRERVGASCLCPALKHLNAFHVAGECRRQVKNVKNLVKNCKIVEFQYHIRNHHEKCIQISTNMPSIGLVIPEITCEMLEF